MLFNFTWPTWTRIISLFGSFASLLGLSYTISPIGTQWSKVQWLLLAAAGVGFVVCLWAEVIDSTRRRIFKLEDKIGIRNYMFRWIDTGGLVAIWTRDLSWVTDDDMRAMLTAKARAKELIICLPKSTEFTAALKNDGATVIEYGSVRNIPSLRFTISHYSQATPNVAIGRPLGRRWLIEEFSDPEDPALLFALDLIELASAGQQRNGESTTST